MKCIHIVFVSILVCCAAASDGFAMGRSEDPRASATPALGTDSDAAIRQSDEKLQSLLFDPSAKDKSEAERQSSARAASSNIHPDR